MIKRSKGSLLVLILSVAFILLACSSSGGSEPTQAAHPAEPTATPAEPTEVPEEPTVASEPTEAIAEEPTEITNEDVTDPGQPQEPVETKTPPPTNKLYTENINTYWDNNGYMHVIGLVTNNTTEIFDSIEVQIDIFDSNQILLYNTIESIFLTTLAPGETSPFSHLVGDVISDPGSYATAKIISQNPTDIERITIKIEGTTQIVDDFGYVHVIGKLVNNTQSPVMINGLAAATFTENGNLYSAGPYTSIVLYLDPGEDGPFRVTMTGPGEDSKINNHEVYLDAVTAIPVEYFDLTISENHHYYLDSSGGFHLIGEITNNHDEFLTLSLVASIYNEGGNVVDANTTEIPTFSIAPGETLPYDFQYWGPLDNKSGAFETARSYFVQVDPYWVFSSPAGHIDLITQNNSNQLLDSSQVYFIGEVLNNSNEIISSATIIVSLYDVKSEQLIATGYGLVFDPINPNDKSNYEVWINVPMDFDMESVEIKIIAKGDLP